MLWSSSFLLKMFEMFVCFPTSATVKEKFLHVYRVLPTFFHISAHVENKKCLHNPLGFAAGPGLWLLQSPRLCRSARRAPAHTTQLPRGSSLSPGTALLSGWENRCTSHIFSLPNWPQTFPQMLVVNKAKAAVTTT